MSELNFLKYQSPGTPVKELIYNRNVVASTSGLNAVPLAYITHMSGTSAITLIPLPWPGFAGTICLIPSGAFTGATGGTATATNKPIGKAFTAVVGQALFLTYSPVTELWYPSY